MKYTKPHIRSMALIAINARTKEDSKYKVLRNELSKKTKLSPADVDQKILDLARGHQKTNRRNHHGKSNKATNDRLSSRRA